MYANYTIRKERIINASLQKVWETLAIPENMERWLGAKVESNMRIGEPITFSYVFYNKTYSDKGMILQNEPMNLLAYTYWSAFSGLPDELENYSMVTYELQPDEDNFIRLIMLHHDIHDKEFYEYANKNWEETLDNFKLIAEAVESYAII